MKPDDWASARPAATAPSTTGIMATSRRVGFLAMLSPLPCKAILHRHLALLMRAAGLGDFRIVAGHYPHAFIERRRDRVRPLALQEGELVLAAGGEHLG